MLTDVSRIQFHPTILTSIGRTPLVRINKLARGYKPHIFAKIESFNPGGSVKDRIGLEIVEEAEREGRLKPGGTIVEATSGNTGVALAIVAAIKGYKTVFTVPDKMSQEKIWLLRAYGAEVLVTPTAVPHDSPESYTEVAKRVVRETPNSILANQYFNPKNIEAHYKSTGPEIWEQTGGQVDYFVCGVGTGGTITGAGKYLKEMNPNIKVVGIDPKGSILREYFYTKKYSSVLKTYKVEGIGQDWMPGTLDFDYVDEMIEVTDKESFLMARRLTKDEGIFVGGSSGTAMAGTFKLAERLGERDVVVVILPDTGERYLSKIYSDDWLRENRFLEPERVTLRYILQGKSKELPPLVYVAPLDNVRRALDLIRDHNISQLPVMEMNDVLGSITEGMLINAVLQKASLLDEPVEKNMEPPLPKLDADTNIEHAVDLLGKKNPAVLVEDDSKIVGIVTRFDMLEYLSR
ncbi:MAG: cystathionine beta-synthase [Bacteroidota bacterium]